MIATHTIAFPMMIRFLSLRSGGNLSCCIQRAAVHVFGHHGASPELFREVDGSRIAAVSVFFKSLATTVATCALQSLCHQAVSGSLWLSMNNLVQTNAVIVLCCHRSDAEFVQLKVENRTTDFVPRFSIMHGCVESRATR